VKYADLQHLLRLIESQARDAATLAAMGAETRTMANCPPLATPDNPNPPSRNQILERAANMEAAARSKITDVLNLADRMKLAIFGQEPKLPGEPTSVVPGAEPGLKLATE